MTTELTLEELAGTGERDLGASPWVKVEQKHIQLFADATGDHQWIHVDPEAAKAGPFGGTIAHGYLSLSLLPALLSNLIHVRDAHMGVNYGIERVRFTAPVPSGSEVRVHAKLVSSEPKGDGILYKVGVQIEIKGQEKPAMVGEVLYLALGSPPEPQSANEEAKVTDGADLDTIFQGMQQEFQPDRASGVDATVQWVISDGGEEKPYFLTIKDGTFAWEHGQTESPTVTLSTDSDSFVALMTGKAQGAALYMSGKLRIQGDLMLAQRMSQFFAAS
ncbi:MAG TPA: MaoC/PaaZ C-terminal domain-containing protein [Gaiellaceae bacterium]|nr:MaoC/PaaZ C-terminal domain-containing protein [Gaiellaceae bacterium]